MSTLDQFRHPPQSTESEQTVLGGLLIDNKCYEDVLELIGIDDFYLEAHRYIFEAIGLLYEQKKLFDVLTVKSKLEQMELLESVGGSEYLGYLSSSVVTSVNIRSYAEIIRERSVLRHILGFSTELAETAYHPEERTIAEILDVVESRALELSETGRHEDKTFFIAGELVGSVSDKLMELSTREGDVTGLATHYTDFDKMTSGLHEGELFVLAARPSMGKTALALNIIERVAMKEKKTVAFFSMEMPSEQIIMRLFASFGKFDFSKLRLGKLTSEEWIRFGKVVSNISEAPIYIDDSSNLSPLEVKSRARKIRRDYGSLDMVVVDYLQLMKGVSHTENRTGEISEISRLLKTMARELKIPVIALSQLNRSVESRTNKRPMMSDLRESGAIEQDADLIAFIYRDEVYNEDSKAKGTAEIIIAKQRNGPIGKVILSFLGKYIRFENHISIPTDNHMPERPKTDVFEEVVGFGTYDFGRD